MMNKEIVTDPLDVEDLWFDLRENIQLIQQMALTDVRLFFGFSWGKYIYENEWQEIAVSPDEIEPFILDAQGNQYGHLGDDNMYIRIPEIDVQVQYSYETDIHLSYCQDHLFVKTVLERWSSKEWLLDQTIWR